MVQVTLNPAGEYELLCTGLNAGRAVMRCLALHYMQIKIESELYIILGAEITGGSAFACWGWLVPLNLPCATSPGLQLQLQKGSSIGLLIQTVLLLAVEYIEQVELSLEDTLIQFKICITQMYIEKTNNVGGKALFSQQFIYTLVIV